MFPEKNPPNSILPSSCKQDDSEDKKHTFFSKFLEAIPYFTKNGNIVRGRIASSSNKGMKRYREKMRAHLEVPESQTLDQLESGGR